MPADPIDTINLLQDLGFTQIEAATYVALLSIAPATAYQVAKKTGKPIANTYKAIASLASRGAVTREHSGKQLCTATPPEQLIELLRDHHTQSSTRLGKLLKDIQPSKGDPRVYQIEDIDAMYSRCRAMIRGAKSVVLIEAFPVPLKRLAPDLSGAAKRGVSVTAQVYQNETIPGVRCVGFPRAAEVLQAEPGQLLTLTVDRRQALLSLTSHDQARVIQAVHTASSFIASIITAYLGSEVLVSHVLRDEAMRAEFKKRSATLRAHVAPPPGPMILVDHEE
jgi:HTH-type transcriptional regulator, sugar sensing transcriptional regulator